MQETPSNGLVDLQATHELNSPNQSRQSQKKQESTVLTGQRQILKNNELIPVLDNPDGNVELIHYLETQQLKYTQKVNHCQNPKEKSILQELMRSTQIQIDKLKNPDNDVSNFGISLLKEMESTSIRTVRLKKIYDFYSKIFYTKGLKTDFGRISEESHSLTEGKFIIFCRQFNILDEKVHHKVEARQESVTVILNDSVRTHKWWQKNQYLQKPQQTITHKQFTFREIHQIFKNISQNQSHIDFEQFLEIITHFKKSSNMDFDEFLGINSLSYKSKLKSLSVPFNSKEEEGYRKPEGLVPISIMVKDTQGKKELLKKWHLEQRSRFANELSNREASSRSQSTLQISQRPQNYSEIKGRNSQLQFNPKDLIDEQDDDEDQQYIASYIQSNKTESVPNKTDILKTGSKTTGRRRTNNSNSTNFLKLPSLQK